MKYIKMLGLLAVAAAALMAFAGTASATTLTSPAETTYTNSIAATAGETTLHGVATITCLKSSVEGPVEAHGSEVTTRGSINSLKFETCGTDHVTVLTNGTGAFGTGTLEIHTQEKKPNKNGTLTSNGTRITIQITALGISCVFETQNTHIGTVTGGTPAVLHIESAPIPRVDGDSGPFCTSEPGIWTGSYTVKTPSTLLVD
jgi:hypothetical protein